MSNMNIGGWPRTWLKWLGLRRGELQTDSDQIPELYVDALEEAPLDQANLVVSRFAGGGIETHALLLDLDVEHEYWESSTPGHGHLLVNLKLTRQEWQRVMQVLRDVGVISPGYHDHSQRRGFASLRLPWIKKEEVDPILARKLNPPSEPF